MREALSLLIEQQHDMRVAAQAAALGEVVSLDIEPDVVVTELKLPDAQDGEAIAPLAERFPEASILVLTDVRHPLRIRAAHAAGARGYLLKSATGEDLFAAIRAVAHGEEYLQPSLGVALARSGARASSDEGDASDRLSPREEEVLRLVAFGLTNREIAERLGVSKRTVETQRASILQKLGHPTRAELVRYALDAGLLDLDE